MNVLVTGTNGFVGRALCKKMLAKGWQVRGTIRDSKHLNELPTEVDVALVESIGSDTDWSKALQDVDTVVHLAAHVHVINDTASDPLAAFRRVNVNGTERLWFFTDFSPRHFSVKFLQPQRSWRPNNLRSLTAIDFA